MSEFASRDAAECVIVVHGVRCVHESDAARARSNSIACFGTTTLRPSRRCGSSPRATSSYACAREMPSIRPASSTVHTSRPWSACISFTSTSMGWQLGARYSRPWGRSAWTRPNATKEVQISCSARCRRRCADFLRRRAVQRCGAEVRCRGAVQRCGAEVRCRGAVQRCGADLPPSVRTVGQVRRGAWRVAEVPTLGARL
jgi:hypothetical protein